MADEAKTELIRDLDRARSQASFNRRALANDLRLGPKIKRSVERNKGAWIGAAILFGLILSRLTARTKKVVVADPKGSKVEKELKTAGVVGMLLPVVKMAFDLAKPALTKYAMEWVSQRTADRRP